MSDWKDFRQKILVVSQNGAEMDEINEHQGVAISKTSMLELLK